MASADSGRDRRTAPDPSADSAREPADSGFHRRTAAEVGGQRPKSADSGRNRRTAGAIGGQRIFSAGRGSRLASPSQKKIDGKDGGLAALRELLDGTLAPGALQAVTAVFVPVLNVDGHERFKANQRPNQRGPEETGFRTTAQNLNLNRDYVKAEAPEMQALLALFDAWDPAVFFNTAFERKEGMEAYVAEEEARKMLARDPALRAAFTARLQDPAFAGSPRERLDFFYQRHAAWDERVNVIPVVRVAASPLAEGPK